MKQKAIFCIASLVLFLFSPYIFGDDILYLKSGAEIKGKITEETDDYVKINVKDIMLAFFKDEISRIDSEVLISLKEENIETPDKLLNELPASFYIKYERKFFPTNGDLLCGGEIHIHKKNNKIAAREIFKSNENILVADTLFLYDGSGNIYVIDIVNKTGQVYPVEMLLSIYKKYNYDIEIKNFTQSLLALKWLEVNAILMDDDTSQLNLPQEDILDKKCIVVSSDNQTKYVWNKIPFKIENKFKFLTRDYIDKIEAVLFNNEGMIEDSIFTSPEGIKYNEVNYDDLVSVFQEIRDDFEMQELGIYHVHMKKVILNLNEVSAVLSLKKILVALSKYIGTSKKHKFPTDLTELSKHIDIGEELDLGYKDGYIFKYTPIIDEFGVRNEFTLFAAPWKEQKTGNRHFFSDQSGVIKTHIEGKEKIIDAISQ